MTGTAVPPSTQASAGNTIFLFDEDSSRQDNHEGGSSQSKRDLSAAGGNGSSTDFHTRQSTTSNGPVLAKEETRDVHRFRLFMLLILLVFAVLVSTIVFFYSRNVEEQEFESEFESNGNKVIRAFQEDSFRKVCKLLQCIVQE
jgi:hypothetical protein